MQVALWILLGITPAGLLVFVLLIRHVRRRAEHDREWHG